MLTRLLYGRYYRAYSTVLRHLLCNNRINRMLKNVDLLWKLKAKERRFPTSPSCTGDDGEPFDGLMRTLCGAAVLDGVREMGEWLPSTSRWKARLYGVKYRAKGRKEEWLSNTFL